MIVYRLIHEKGYKDRTDIRKELNDYNWYNNETKDSLEP